MGVWTWQICLLLQEDHVYNDLPVFLIIVLKGKVYGFGSSMGKKFDALIYRKKYSFSEKWVWYFNSERKSPHPDQRHVKNHYQRLLLRHKESHVSVHCFILFLFLLSFFSPSLHLSLSPSSSVPYSLSPHFHFSLTCSLVVTFETNLWCR